MILQCPSCDSRFLVNDALIPLVGRDVRCGNCKHTWFVSPNPIPMDGVTAEKAATQTSPVFADFDHALANATADEAEDMAMSASADAQLPALQAKAFNMKRAILPTAGLSIAALCMALMAYYPSWKHAPIASGVYGMLGYEDTKGLALSDMNLVRETSDSKTRFLVSGNVMNRNEENTLLPEVRVSLLDSTGEVMWSRSYVVNKTLSANDIYPFRITNAETAFGDKVAQVMVDVGNSYEMMVR
jgi:predicted Zn finger-like uncharacterized protein